MDKANKIIQYILVVAILGGLVYFYWYSRNYVAGYYELTWFAGETVWIGSATKWLFISVVATFAGWVIYYKVRRSKAK